MLIAGRPIGIRALKQSIPDNFTLMTAAAGDQIANPLKEAKHGMFSYFLNERHGRRSRYQPRQQDYCT